MRYLKNKINKLNWINLTSIIKKKIYRNFFAYLARYKLQITLGKIVGYLGYVDLQKRFEYFSFKMRSFSAARRSKWDNKRPVYIFLNVWNLN